jgi:hypothetical protein
MQDPDVNLLIPPDLHARIRQAFLLGLARQPVAPPPSLTGLLPPGCEQVLALLALAGQRQRFAGPPRPAAGDVPEAARRLHADPRPIPPPGARRALNRLSGSVEKSLAGGVMPIALRRVGAAGFRAHPFDLPDLARHIKADAENVGLAERAYLALVAPEADEDAVKALFFDRITADNWTTFPKTQRRTFVAAVRRENPAEGRALIESVWKTEPAPVRAAVLEALAVGLGEDDKPFLDKLATDRADSVKQAALRLLARMPSAEAFRQRVATAAQCFKRTGKGVGRVMAALGIGGEGTLTFAPASGLTFAALDLLFSGMPLKALAEAVGVTPAEIIGALPEDEHHVRKLLFDSAVEAGDTTTVQSIIKARLLSSQALAGHVIMPLATAARRPLDHDSAARLLAAPAWRNAISDMAGASAAVPKDDGRFVFTAALMPREAMPAFVASLSAAPLSATRAARDFADLVLALPDRPQPVSGASS